MRLSRLISFISILHQLVGAYLVSPPGIAAPGASEYCSEWVQESDTLTCTSIEESFKLTAAQFEAWNPIVTELGSGCVLIPTLYYCVQINYSTAPTSSTSSPTSTTSSTSTKTATATCQMVTAVEPPTLSWSACGMGCYTDDGSARTLNYQVLSIPANSMTVELCQSTCASLGYTIAGVEYAQQCFCDTSFRNEGGPALDGDAQCNMACLGNPSETCGGSARLDVYQISGWILKGCYTDSSSARSLTYQVLTSPTEANSMTIELCISTCASLGYIYAGLEYAQQCFCDSTIQNNRGVAPSGSVQCNMACLGDTAETCGGSSVLDIYQNTAAISGWFALGCYSDIAAARALSILGSISGGTEATTIESCQAACLAAGYTLAGVEFGQQCWCDNSLRSGGPAPNSNAQCNMPCIGNSSEICGGGNRLNLYQYVGWEFLGCFADSASARVLSQVVTVPGGQSVTTIEACQTACKNAGYNFAGVEYGQECHCDNLIQNGGALALDGNAQCNMACSGNSGEICGGGNRLDLYSYNTTVGIKTWSLLGCYTDSSSARTLANVQTIPGGPSTLTVEICQALCHDAGYILAGMEYSQECWCDQKIENNGLASDSTTCNMACLGDSGEICGGSGRISVYQYAY